MSTGVTFGTAHSYRTWGLKLKKISIGFPEVKTAYVSVPGMDGDLDLTEATYGRVTYGMRTLEFVFDARNCKYTDWSTLISRISVAIHGKKLAITLDTDPDYRYAGRCEISTEKTNNVTAQITISCNCDPFKTKADGSGGIL